jgi:hypothetical protein
LFICPNPRDYGYRGYPLKESKIALYGGVFELYGNTNLIAISIEN